MADVKTFTGFKDWMLVILLGGNLAMQFNINSTVNMLAINDAVRAAQYEEANKKQREFEGDLRSLQKDHDRQSQDIAILKEYLKPSEVREHRKMSSR